MIKWYQKYKKTILNLSMMLCIGAIMLLFEELGVDQKIIIFMVPFFCLFMTLSIHAFICENYDEMLEWFIPYEVKWR